MVAVIDLKHGSGPRFLDRIVVVTLRNIDSNGLK